jgi:hypothetical protein
MLEHQVGDASRWDLFVASEFEGREALADMIGGQVSDRPDHLAQTNRALFQPLIALCEHPASVEHRKSWPSAPLTSERRKFSIVEDRSRHGLRRSARGSHVLRRPSVRIVGDEVLASGRRS